MRRMVPSLALGLLLLLSSCAPLPGLPATPTPTAVPAQPPAASPTATEDRPNPRPQLVLWLPPPFDPQQESEAGQLLSARLKAFSDNHPGLAIEVRVKAEEGPGGLLETLRAASTAAPAALPDIIALDPAGLNTAALKGLILPLEGLLQPPTDADWFAHTHEAARIDGQFYGYPFASDALVMAYRPGAFETAPRSWGGMMASERTFLFPAADPQALFTLAQYQDVGGALVSDAGRPSLDPIPLANLLGIYGSARSAGVLPSGSADFETAEDTWEALLAGQVHSAVAPFSSYSGDRGRQLISAAPMITRDGTGVSIGQTWSWAIVAQDLERQQLAAELILWLHDAAFLGPWTEATGLIPPTPAALDRWSESGDSSVTTLLAGSLQARPSEESLATFGPPLREAVLSVLQGGTTPDAAALRAAQSVQGP